MSTVRETLEAVLIEESHEDDVVLYADFADDRDAGVMAQLATTLGDLGFGIPVGFL